MTEKEIYNNFLILLFIWAFFQNIKEEVRRLRILVKRFFIGLVVLLFFELNIGEERVKHGWKFKCWVHVKTRT